MNIYGKILELSSCFEKYAFNTVNAVLKRVNIPLLNITEGNYSVIIPLAEENGLLVPKGMVSLDVPDFKIRDGLNKSEWKKISAIWSDDPWITVYLFGAAIHLGNKIVTDSKVVPATIAIAKRIYEKYKNNPDIIVEKVVDERALDDKPWLQAGYIDDRQNEAEYNNAFKAGEEIKKLLSTNDLEQLINIVQYHWNQRYKRS